MGILLKMRKLNFYTKNLTPKLVLVEIEPGTSSLNTYSLNRWTTEAIKIWVIYYLLTYLLRTTLLRTFFFEKYGYTDFLYNLFFSRYYPTARGKDSIPFLHSSRLNAATGLDLIRASNSSRHLHLGLPRLLSAFYGIHSVIFTHSSLDMQQTYPARSISGYELLDQR